MASEIEINQLCRLCLVKEQVNVPIFEEEGDLGQIFLKISACLPVKISRDDSLPKKICDSCSCKLDVVYQFWNTSANSEKQLLKWLNQLGVVNTMTSTNNKNSDSQMAHSLNPDTVINLKQEVVELAENEDDDNMTTEEMDDSNDSENYMLQQQHIPYDNFSFQDGFPNEEPSHAVASSTVTSKTVNTRPKRKRRATTKALQSQLDSEDEDDSLLRGKITKTEEQSDSGEDPEPTAFVGLPSTSTDDQPGPSGINKGNAEAPLLVMIQPENYNPDGLLFQNTSTVIKAEVVSIDLVEWVKNLQLVHEPNFIINCIICNRLFMIKELNRHIKSHINQDLSCDICGKVYATQRNLNRHKKSHESRKAHQCKICLKTFPYAHVLKDHMVSAHTVEKLWFCDLCQQSFKVKKALGMHLRNRHSNGRPHGCDLCEKAYPIASLLKQHYKISHSTGAECLICNEVFPSYYSLQTHKKLHREPVHIECPICQKVFDNNPRFKRHHFRVHGDKQKFICELCGKHLTSSSSLRDHQLIHSGIKPFECHDCGNKFNKKSSLRSHVLVHSGGKPHSCPTCSKNFSQRSSLVIHMRIHSGERPYNCEFCDKAFISRNLLNCHKKNHGY